MAERQEKSHHGIPIGLTPKHVLDIFNECMLIVIASDLFKPRKRIKVGKNQWHVIPSTEQVTTAKWITDWILTERKG